MAHDEPISVAVSGAGNMGSLVVDAVQEAPDLMLARVFNPRTIEISELRKMDADVMVDFSNSVVTERLLLYTINRDIHPVIGTSGLSSDWIQLATKLCEKRGLGGVIAPNFSLGGALMMRFATQAARFYDSADIMETHHDRKVDAPSGTAIATAQHMRQARERNFEHNAPKRRPLPGARGAERGGVSIHSRRLPGAVAHHEVVLGGVGELLTIRHDSISRESFIPGVLHAIRTVQQLDRMVIGLDQLLDL